MSESFWSINGKFSLDGKAIFDDPSIVLNNLTITKTPYIEIAIYQDKYGRYIPKSMYIYENGGWSLIPSNQWAYGVLR